MNNIKDIQAKRLQFLIKVYEHTGDDSLKRIDMFEVGKELGFDDALTTKIVRYLIDEGLIECRTIGKMINITHLGIQKVEEYLSVQDKNTELKQEISSALSLDKQSLLAELNRLIESKDEEMEEGPTSNRGRKWIARALSLLKQFDKHYEDTRLAEKLEQDLEVVFLQLSSYTLGPIWHNMLIKVQMAIEILNLDLKQFKSKVYAGGEDYNLYMDLKEIIGAAKSKVFIIEPYADEDIFDLYLGKAKTGISIQFLTKKPSGKLITVMNKFKRNPNYKFDARRSDKFHDRVIFIDDIYCWVIGQSIRNAAKTMPTYLNPIESVSDMKKFYDDIWDQAACLI